MEFIREHHFKQLKKDNKTKYFLTGLSSFNGTLRSIDHSSLEYIKKRFAADGIEYRRNGCYVLRVKMFDKEEIIQVPCRHLPPSYVICRRQCCDSGRQEQDHYVTGEAAAIYGDDLNEIRHRRTRRDVAGASDDASTSLTTFIICFLVGFCFGSICVICAFKRKEISKALNKKSDSKEAEEGQGGKEEEEKAEDAKTEDAGKGTSSPPPAPPPP
ncbi:unnamed protein product [Enterobius vermicularis]|uniref:Recep_L_domain domain-containing protein n=1 Tax=Enterobius vermicularis TaxID=51028 RepID=A0A0N4V775_ENTVE|nr:unnamed protein product [Enterobius vermicularis]